MSRRYVKGTTVRVSVDFFNFSGALADPSTVTVTTQGPGITGEEAFVFGVDSEVVKDATGQFHFDFELTDEGTYWVRFAGTGAVGAAFEEQFQTTSQFDGS